MACLAAPAPALESRPRVVVLTDLDIQGIVATTSVHMRAAIHPEYRRVIVTILPRD
jgi:hypothetical protein